MKKHIVALLIVVALCGCQRPDNKDQADAIDDGEITEQPEIPENDVPHDPESSVFSKPLTPDYSTDRWIENMELANRLGYRFMNIADFAALENTPTEKTIVLRHDIHYRDVRDQEADPHTGKREVQIFAEAERQFASSSASYYPMWNWYHNGQVYQDGYTDLIHYLVDNDFEVGIHHDNFSEALDEKYGSNFDSELCTADICDPQCIGLTITQCAIKTYRYSTLTGYIVDNHYSDWIDYQSVWDMTWGLFQEDIQQWEAVFGDMRSTCGHGSQSARLGNAFKNPSLMMHLPIDEFQNSGVETDCNRPEALKDAWVLGDSGGWGERGSLFDALKAGKNVIYVNTHPYTWTNRVAFDCDFDATTDCRKFTHGSNFITAYNLLSPDDSGAFENILGSRGTIQLELDSDIMDLSLGNIKAHAENGSIEYIITDLYDNEIQLIADIYPGETKIGFTWDAERGASLYVEGEKRESRTLAWDATETPGKLTVNGVSKLTGYDYQRPHYAFKL